MHCCRTQSFRKPNFENFQWNQPIFGLLSSERAAKLIAIFDLAWSSVGLAAGILLAISWSMKLRTQASSDEMRTLTALVIVIVLLWSGFTYISWMLWRGLQVKRYDSVNRWFKITIILLISRFIVFALYLIAHYDHEVAVSTYEIISLIYTCYELWVIKWHKEGMHRIHPLPQPV